MEFIGALDLYGLLVELVFGGVGIAIIGVFILIGLIMYFSKMSFQSFFSISFCYFLICGVYYAWYTHVIILLLVLVYFFFAIVKLFSGER